MAIFELISSVLLDRALRNCSKNDETSGDTDEDAGEETTLDDTGDTPICSHIADRCRGLAVISRHLATKTMEELPLELSKPKSKH